MLQTMRSSAKYVWVFLAFAFIGGFLLAETSGLLGSAPVNATTSVATVNGKDILYVCDGFHAAGSITTLRCTPRLIARS